MSEALERERIRTRFQEKRRRAIARISIAVIMIGIVAAGFWWLLTHEIPTNNRDVLTTLLGAITGSVLTIVSYYFGDSEHGEQ